MATRNITINTVFLLIITTGTMEERGVDSAGEGTQGRSKNNIFRHSEGKLE